MFTRKRMRWILGHLFFLKKKNHIIFGWGRIRIGLVVINCIVLFYHRRSDLALTSYSFLSVLIFIILLAVVLSVQLHSSLSLVINSYSRPIVTPYGRCWGDHFLVLLFPQLFHAR